MAGSALRLQGDRIYASNRGRDSVAVFGWADDSLRLLGQIDTRGNGPRDFAISPDGALLVCASQASDSATVFALQGRGADARFL